MKRVSKLLTVSLFTAITASLCCITPFLALIAGTSGLVSNFSWIEPYRPFLIGLTILFLGFAWYQKLKPQEEMDCECEKDDKPNFFHSKKFLGLVTVFAFVMMAFPYYSGIFYPNVERQIILVNKSDIKISEFKISGMTCAGCEEHVNHELNKLKGVVNSKVSYENGNAIIEFDRTKTDETEIEQTINSTGYKVTEIKEK